MNISKYIKKIICESGFYKKIFILCLTLTAVFCLCSCEHNYESTESSEIIPTKKDEIKDYVEKLYGIADNPVYGTQTINVISDKGYINTKYDVELKNDTNMGSVFYKAVKTDEYPNGLICAYLSKYETSSIALHVVYKHDYKAENYSESHTFDVSLTDSKKRCYVIIKNDYLVIIEMTENDNANELTDDSNNSTYEETITIYNITDDLNEEFSITRKVEKLTTKELKNFHISKEKSKWIYAEGYGSYTAEGADFLSTQKEFCDKANEMLESILGNDVTLSKLSWNNRWYGIDVDEEVLNDNMVKVDYTTDTSTSTINNANDKIVDFTIKINDEKQEPTDNIELEEIEDNPVTYNNDSAKEVEEVVMPENLPTSIDANTLQDLRYFNIDGFWYTDDLRYVYHIYTQHPDNGFGTLYFADLSNSKKPKHGQVKQTSSYSVILKAMENNGFSPEVFATNNQLKSDEITLTRVNNNIVNNILGSWSDDDVTYTFKSDGKYDVDTPYDSYWGYYFIIDETNIVLGRYSDDLELQSYKIENGTMVLNKYLTLKHQ